MFRSIPSSPNLPRFEDFAEHPEWWPELPLTRLPSFGRHAQVTSVLKDCQRLFRYWVKVFEKKFARRFPQENRYLSSTATTH
jgi:hypothetical protein